LEGAGVIAYKFLTSGRVGPVSGVAWPEPGVWISAEGELTPCARGLHVCQPEDLAHWLGEELWELETSGDARLGLDCLVVPKAQLVRRVDEWSNGGAARFTAACAEHAAAIVGDVPAPLAFVDDGRLAAAGGYFAVSAYCAALAVANHAVVTEREQAYRRERAWQGAWIARELL
jgi:hypothetical protein